MGKVGPKRIVHGQPFVINKNLGSAVAASDEAATRTNADGRSVLLFAEPLTHSGHPWTDEHHDLIAIACLYNAVDGGWSKPLNPDPELLRSMPPLRRTLFRDRCTVDNVVDKA